MKLGRVVGQVTATAKEEALTGFKLLLVADLKVASPDDTTTGEPYVAADLVGAGEGEVVIIAQGSAARTTKRTESVPVDSAVVAIVDSVGLGGRTTYTNSA